MTNQGSPQITPDPQPPAPLPWWRLALGVLAGVAVFLLASLVRHNFNWSDLIAAVGVTTASIAFMAWRRRH